MQSWASRCVYPSSTRHSKKWHALSILQCTNLLHTDQGVNMCNCYSFNLQHVQHCCTTSSKKMQLVYFAFTIYVYFIHHIIPFNDVLNLFFSDMAPNASGNHTMNHEAILVSIKKLFFNLIYVEIMKYSHKNPIKYWPSLFLLWLK